MSVADQGNAGSVVLSRHSGALVRIVGLNTMAENVSPFPISFNVDDLYVFSDAKDNKGIVVTTENCIAEE